MGFIEGSVASSSSALPLQRLIEATMRGNAEAQAQTAVKDVAGKQADARQKLQVTMTADPNDPGNPYVHIKNAKSDQLNQTQGSDLQEAYDKPKKNVEDAIAKMNAPQVPAGQFERESLSSVGYPPERTDVTGADLNTYGRDYRAQRDLGEPILKAAIKAGIMRTGAWNRDRIAEELDRRAALKNAAAFKAAAEPAILEQDRQTRENRAEAQFAQTTAHQRQLEDDARTRIADTEKKAVYAKQNASVKGIDFSMVPAGDGNAGWHQAADDSNDSGTPYTKEQYALIDRKAARDVQKFYNDFFIAKKDVYQLGHFPTFDDAKSAYGHPFASKEEEARARNAWATAHEYDQQQDERRNLSNQATEARLELSRERLANGTKTNLNETDVKDFSVDDLLSFAAKAKNGEQAIARKSALLQKTIRDESDKQKDLQSRIDDEITRAHTSGREAALAHYKADFQIAMRKASDARDDLAKIDARRKGASQPVAPSAPAPSASVPKFKQIGTVTLTGGQKVRAGTNDGKTFFDLQTGAPIQ